MDDTRFLPAAKACGPHQIRGTAIALDPNAPAAKDCYGPILDIIAKSGVALDTITLHSRGDWKARANWKAMLENYEAAKEDRRAMCGDTGLPTPGCTSPHQP